ncbi:DUF1804 family protein [Arcicella sp. LKC2W]|uniref:DUF1804 family protein n=1 Tax=Arcicella sp. LKC2W TaxID=2984198 RepID=UPI002B1EC0FC|nr:DUF1804 family protein [Arcicella sp. LKC2W]MEA5461561.1 DUF1804 family protein [Arcicella sp. LKC2W]
MTQKEKRENAMSLFVEQSFSKQKIAKFCGVSVQTISAWAEEDDWDSVRMDTLRVEKNMKMRIYKLIDHSLQVFEQEIENQKNEGKLKHLDKGQIDGLSKLLAGIKAKELSFSESVKLLTEFMEYVNTQDNHLAKELIPFIDGFISALRAK